MTLIKVNKLPHCKYPTANEYTKSDLPALPQRLTPINWSKLISYRVSDFNVSILNELINSEVLEMAKMLAKSFVKNEPTNRHLIAPKLIPKPLKEFHKDEFGKHSFGEWTKENIFYWLIRLAFLTNPNNLSKNQDILDHSIAVKNNSNKIIAGILSKTLSSEDGSIRNNSYLSAVFGLYSTILELLFAQEQEAINILTQKYSNFKVAFNNNKVATTLMLAKEDEFSKESAFELFIRAIELLQNKGFKYVVIAASNQWTGAACEMLNATRVNYKPFRDVQRVPTISNASDFEMHSTDGFISDKDSGIMFYIIKLL